MRRAARLLFVALAIAVPAGAIAATPTRKITVTIVVQGPGPVVSRPAGISCPGRCKSSFPAGKPLTLTATGTTGGTFNHWASPCKGSSRCTLRPTGARRLVAVFVAPVPPAPTPTPPPATGPAFLSGHYVGATSDGFGISFDAGNGRITNFVLQDSLVSCSPVGSGRTGPIAVADLAALADAGTFALEYDSTFHGGDYGVSDGPFQFKIAGQLSAAAAAGTLTMGLVTTYATIQIECSSGIVRWTADRTGP